ncbi:MAG: 50S ribosomal protein L17 [Chloroflexi bacterium]|nr:50S ribosomal protein L17 [Chloroflexota bacterium]
MRHRVAGRQFSRATDHRLALFRNLATDLLEHERIVTTLAKAKETRIFAERMITLGKEKSLHARRQALSFVYKKDVVDKLFADLADRYKDRSGGYTRIIRLGPRPGDSAMMAQIELVDAEEKAKKKK